MVCYGMLCYAILCYGMVWYGMESMVSYDISMLCYEISMLCYAMVYVVKDKHSATVWERGSTSSGDDGQIVTCSHIHFLDFLVTRDDIRSISKKTTWPQP